MPINQLSTANTFEQWLISTQVLIEQSNYFEDRSNATLDAANTTSNLYPIILSSANQVANNTAFVANTANIIFDYVETSFDVANTVLEISLESFDHANAAFDHANSSFDHANGAYDLANSTFEEANSAFEHANSAFDVANNAYEHSNGAFGQANLSFDRANTAFDTANSIFDYLSSNANLALIIDDVSTDNSSNLYLLFSEDTGVLFESRISKNKLSYNPLTGTIHVVSATFTGNSHIIVPVGDESERPANAAPGMIRYNNEANTFEGYTYFWGPIAGGATGAPNNPVFWENDQTVTGDYVINTNKNAGTFGPVTIADGVTVTVPANSVWTIV
jgi:hypothetical protein